MDSRSTGNYIDAQEGTVRKLQAENEEVAKELRWVDGSIAKMEG